MRQMSPIIRVQRIRYLAAAVPLLRRWTARFIGCHNQTETRPVFDLKVRPEQHRCWKLLDSEADRKCRRIEAPVGHRPPGPAAATGGEQFRKRIVIETVHDRSRFILAPATMALFTSKLALTCNPL